MIEKEKDIEKIFYYLEKYLNNSTLKEQADLYVKIRDLKFDLAEMLLGYSIEDLAAYGLNVQDLIDSSAEDTKESI